MASESSPDSSTAAARDSDDYSDLPTDRPDRMPFVIQMGMLKTLGINLYTSIGKVLVEFIANAYDSDATQIQISLPWDNIHKQRIKLRDELKSQLDHQQHAADEKSTADMFDVMQQTLDENTTVVLEDDGHGMTWQDVWKKFLPVNRERRRDRNNKETRLTSESGNRFVMGRKGVGKLAGFGAAGRVEIWTKRKGSTAATIITLTDNVLEQRRNTDDYPVPVTYEDGLAVELSGTRVTLSRLKADAFKESVPSIKSAINKAFFAIQPDDFAIWLNGELVESPPPTYEFIYPPDLKAGEFAEDAFEVEGLGSIEFRYFIGFRGRNEHLTAKERGVRVYCNHRLAAGPTLLGLGTGMHSFHSQDYMEGIVEVDALDRGSVDLINTARTQFREGNEFFDGLSDRLTTIMTEALKAHGKFREKQAGEELEADPKAKVISRVVATLPKRTRKAATRLMTTIAVHYPPGTVEFEELAPIIVNSVNATQVLSKLIELGSRPETLDRVARELRELAEIERIDALKLYRGRRSGIQALETLMVSGEEELWQKKMIEAELHSLLKQNPWLIRPEYSDYLTSDENINRMVSKLAKELSVDKFAKVDGSDGVDATRPDLVFVMSDQSSPGPSTIHVVELKSPSTPLTIEHFHQLEEYIFKIKTWCESELPQAVAVHGWLIGAMPDSATRSVPQKQLLRKFKDSGPADDIRIVGMRQLIKESWDTHLAAIRTLESELGEDDDETED